MNDALSTHRTESAVETGDIVAAFAKTFGCQPSLVAAAPGRVNLIGEHVDYNAGWVLPFAIDRRIVVAACPTTDKTIAAHSAAMQGEFQFSIDDQSSIVNKTNDMSWHTYVRGIAVLLSRLGANVGGAKLYIGGDLPPGSGLSSSAALTVSVGRAIAALCDFSIEPTHLAMTCQQVEHEFAGTPCGIMDPYVSCFAREGAALLIDCITNTHQYVELDSDGISFLVIPSGVKHALADGAYESRRRACERAVEMVRRQFGDVQSMRDVTADMLQECSTALDTDAGKRAGFVVGEIARVHQAVEAVRKGDWPRMGQLMNETQRGLRDQYEVSCDEIDRIVRLLAKQKGVLGARMIGGGFGGVVLAIVRTDAVDAVVRMLRTEYYGPAEIGAEPFTVMPCGGASVCVM